MKPARSYYRWQAEEEQLLRELWPGDADLSDADLIAAKLKRSRDGVINRAIRLGIYKPTPWREYSPQEDAALLSLRAGGRSWRQISAHLHLSKNACIGRCFRLRLGKPCRIEPSLPRLKFLENAS